jgi:hypothetical protein
LTFLSRSSIIYIENKEKEREDIMRNLREIDKSDLDLCQPHCDLVAAYHRFVDENDDDIGRISLAESKTGGGPFLNLEGYLYDMGEL